MKLTICPFSVVVFISTIYFGTQFIVVVQQNQEKQQGTKTKKKKGGDDDTDDIENTNITTKSISNHQQPQPHYYTVIFVLGGPGVGKGTQCTKFVTEHGEEWITLSSGDLLRAERSKKDSPLADQINACIAAGQLVKSEYTCQLLQQAMEEAYTTYGITKFLIDGFPRSFDNATVWNTSTIGQCATIQCIIHFVCPEEIAVGRLIQRGQVTGRSDDQSIHTIRARLTTFLKETKPIIDYYETIPSIPVYTITTDQSIESVYYQFQSKIITTTTTTTKQI